MNANTKSAPTEHSRRHAGSVRAKPYGTVGAAMASTGMTPTEYINIGIAAAYCGVSTKTLRRALCSRRLAFFKPGRSYMFTSQALTGNVRTPRWACGTGIGKTRVMTSGGADRINNHAAFIWSVADVLRGDYKQSEYGKVMLWSTGMRREEIARACVEHLDFAGCFIMVPSTKNG